VQLDRVRPAGGARARRLLGARGRGDLWRSARLPRQAVRRRAGDLGVGESMKTTPETDAETDRMRQAMWSVYYKSARRRRSVLPPRLRPMRLEDALDGLIVHRAQTGGARRPR